MCVLRLSRCSTRPASASCPTASARLPVEVWFSPNVFPEETLQIEARLPCERRPREERRILSCLLGFVGLAVARRARAPSLWWTSFRAVAADGPASLNGGSCRAVTAEEPCPAPFCTQACAQRCALNLALPCLTLLQTSSTEPHNGSVGRLWAILDPTILVLLPLHRRSTTCWAHRSPLEWQWLSQHWPHNRMAQMT